MKKLGTAVGVLLLSGMSNHAQETIENYRFKHASAQVLDQSYKAAPNEPRRTSPPLFHLKDRALDTIWRENFSSAQIGTNPNQWATEGTNGDLWKIGDTDDLVRYSSEIRQNKPLLYWDSFTTIGSLNTSANRAASGSISSPTIDLSAAGDLSGGALLRMTTDAHYCCHSMEVPFRIYLSKDGGANWSQPIVPDFGIDRNVILSSLKGAFVFSLDISPYLSAVPTENDSIRFKFEWDGKDLDNNGQYSNSYAWLIDDLHIVKLPNYEVLQQSLWLSDIRRRYENTEIPTSQATSLTLQSKVLSLGSKTPSNFKQEVRLYKDGNLQSSFTKTGGVLPGGATDTLVRNQNDTITFEDAIDISTLSVGQYKVEVVTKYDSSGQDAVPSNDTLSRTFYITSNQMGHADYDQIPIRHTTENKDEAAEIGALFFTPNNGAELHGVNLRIDSVTSGTQVEVNVYQRTGALQYSLIGEPYPFTIDYNEAWKEGFWHTFNLHQSNAANSPVTLSNDKVYLVTIRVPKRGSDGSNYFSYYRSPLDADASGRISKGNGATKDWKFLDADPFMTLNFDQSLSVEEKVKPSPFRIAQNVPNPFDRQTIISYTLEEAADVSVTFSDISGKIVRAVNKGIQPSGSYQLAVEAGDFAKGIYFYTFAIGGQRVTKKMVVNSFE